MSQPRRHVEILGSIGPNWFASVMGTGIVASAAATLPVHIPGLRGFAAGVWVIAAVLLAVLVIVIGGHWLRHPTSARSHARNPQMVHFYGAAPMALITVAVGAVKPEALELMRVTEDAMWQGIADIQTDAAGVEAPSCWAVTSWVIGRRWSWRGCSGRRERRAVWSPRSASRI